MKTAVLKLADMKVVAVLCGWLLAAPAMADERGYSIPGFEEIRVTGPIDVEITTGKGAGARAFADDPAALDRVTLRRAGDQLTVGIRPRPDARERFTRSAPIRLVLSTDRLRRILHSGSGRVTVAGFGSDRTLERSEIRLNGFGTLDVRDAVADDIEIAMQGGGQLNISGTARHATVKLLGASAFDGTGLAVERAEIFHRGPAITRLNVEREVDIDNAGTGTIEISGAPDCDVRSDGSAVIVCNPGRRPRR